MGGLDGAWPWGRPFFAKARKKDAGSWLCLYRRHRLQAARGCRRGILSLMQMPRATVMTRRLKQAGLPLYRGADRSDYRRGSPRATPCWAISTSPNRAR